jgi:RNA polymerase sigma factor (sigma-70 family)
VPPAEGFATRLVLGPALRSQPDRRLVTLVREGYETAFEEIVRRYGRPLGRYASSIVGGRSEDVTQDAFSKALLALRRDGAEIDLRPWLFRIVRNTALNHLRDSPPSPVVLAEAIAGGRNPVEELERREELADLMKRLQALPEPQRAAIVMRELEGLGHDEIAAALGLSGGAARQAIYRARQALRDGAGMLIPLPLLQAMLGGSGSGVAETAGIGAGGIGGAGVALKATAATFLVAGAVGAGVALKDNSRGGEATAASVRQSHVGPNGASASSFAVRGGAAQQRGMGGGAHQAPPTTAENRGGQSAGPDRNGDGEPSGSGATTHGRGESGSDQDPGPSRSGSSGHDGGGSGHGADDSGRDGGELGESGHSGPGGDSGSGEDGSSSGHGESSLESGEDTHSGPGSGGEPEESISSGSDSGGSDPSGDSGSSGSSDGGGGDGGGPGDLLRDLPESGGLSE